MGERCFKKALAFIPPKAEESITNRHSRESFLNCKKISSTNLYCMGMGTCPPLNLSRRTTLYGSSVQSITIITVKSAVDDSPPAKSQETTYLLPGRGFEVSRTPSVESTAFCILSNPKYFVPESTYSPEIICLLISGSEIF